LDQVRRRNPGRRRAIPHLQHFTDMMRQTCGSGR
jgi:hypothetical protein